MLQDCINWDSESNALREAFDKGIDFQKKKEEELKRIKLSKH